MSRSRQPGPTLAPGPIVVRPSSWVPGPIRAPGSIVTSTSIQVVGRVHDRHARGHPARQQPLVEHPPGPGQLRLVVHALDLVEVRAERAGHLVAVRAQDGRYVGEVLLARCVGGRHPLDRVGEQVAVEGEHAGADLGDRPLLGGGVGLLDDARHQALTSSRRIRP